MMHGPINISNELYLCNVKRSFGPVSTWLGKRQGIDPIVDILVTQILRMYHVNGEFLCFNRLIRLQILTCCLHV